MGKWFSKNVDEEVTKDERRETIVVSGVANINTHDFVQYILLCLIFLLIVVLLVLNLVRFLRKRKTAAKALQAKCGAQERQILELRQLLAKENV